MKRKNVLLALAVGLAFLGQTWESRSEEKNKDKEALTDEQFAKMASAIDLAEINLGNLAARLATSSQVKQFGQKMVTDHTKSSRMLLAITDQKSLKTATAMDKKHQALNDKLKTLNGAEFDREYMKHMVMGHEKAVAMYRQQAKQGKDADLKAFAEKTLPVVEMHLKMAKELAGKDSKTETKP